MHFGVSTHAAILLGTVIVALVMASRASANGQATDSVALFASSGVLELTISAPWREIVRKRKVQDAYAATLEYVGEHGSRKKVGLSVERRGKTRQRICRFPPIRLRFDKADVKGTVFEGNKSIKMVTHCNNGARWEQYYVLEMLAYSIYNLSTERSFKVRPVNVNYHDTGRDRNDGPRFAFLIEDDSLVAKRNGLKKHDAMDIGSEQLEPLESSRFALFQYLIGNVDWSSLGGPPGEDCCHNVKLIGPDNDEFLYALPYDFDSSGLVDAQYAVPNEALPISRVSQRLFRGFCVHNSTLATAREEMLDNRSDIMTIVEEAPWLQSRSRKRAHRYLEDGFDTLEDRERFDREITSACRK